MRGLVTIGIILGISQLSCCLNGKVHPKIAGWGAKELVEGFPLRKFNDCIRCRKDKTEGGENVRRR